MLEIHNPTLRRVLDERNVTVAPEQYSQNSHFAEPAWPVMHEAAYYGLAGAVLRSIEPHSEADPVAILLQFLTAFGNAVGISPYYQVEGDKHRAKLFIVTSGATSKGRKGTALGRIRQLMEIADPDWERDSIQSGLSSGEGVIFHVRDPISKLGKDSVIEQVDAGAADKRLMLVAEEFAGALAAAKRRGVKLGGDRGARLTAKARAAGRAAVQARARNRALDLAPTIQELQAAGCASLRAIAAGLEERGIPAPRGGTWSAVQVARLLEAGSIPFGASAGAAEETSKSLRLGEVLPNRSDCPAHNHVLWISRTSLVRPCNETRAR